MPTELLSSSGHALRNLVAGGSLDVEGMHLWLAVHQMLNQFVDLGVIFMAVTFSILFRLPEALRQDAFRIRHQHDFIYKTWLRFQRRQHFVMQHAANFSGFSG